MVESERRVKDKITVEQRYYLMSIESDAQRFADLFFTIGVLKISFIGFSMLVFRKIVSKDVLVIVPKI
jgi:hypothetical protein